MNRAALLAALASMLVAGAPPGAAQAAAKPVSAAQAQRLALGTAPFQREHRRHPGSYAQAKRKDAARWEVNLWARARPHRPDPQLGQAYVRRSDGRVLEVWTGPQVAWTMARGYPGAFGRAANNPWLWGVLALLFVLPFIDPRRPLCWRHADLVALTAMSFSYAAFNDAHLDLSVPIADGVLAYLLVRLLCVGLRRAPVAVRAFRPRVPWQVLAAGVLFLLGLRVGLNVLDGNVIDVGYASVVGADKIDHGRALYGAFPSDIRQGDTYGPLMYLAYTPFEAIWPWHDRWDDLAAAHAAAATFDIGCTGLLFLLGRRLGGIRLGVLLAYAWVAYPFTLLATNSGTNDALPALLVLAALVAAGKPFGRGLFAAAAGLTKFAPLPLLPLLASHGLGGLPLRERVRPLILFIGGCGIALAVAALVVLPHSSLADMWDRTIGYQTGREAPFSLWGLYGGWWTGVQVALGGVAVLLAAALPFVPRRDDVVGLAALSAALLVAFQLVTNYWFYFYLLWALPAVFIALLGRELLPRAAVMPEPAPTLAQAHPLAAALSSG